MDWIASNMTLAPLSSGLHGGLDKAGTLSSRKSSSNFHQVLAEHANPMLARSISIAPCQRALQVLHPEVFAYLLAGRVVSSGDRLGFLYAGRVRIDFVVTGCIPCAPAVQITSETLFEVDINPVPDDHNSS